MSLAESSIAYWEQNQVADFASDVTAEQSLAVLNARNAMYSGLLELMPVDFPGKTILDFGCGPGHDTIMFLLNGAKHVYSVDVSPKGLSSLKVRLDAHGLTERCTVINVDSVLWPTPKVEHIHTAGVIHHLADPITALEQLRICLKPKAEIRMMVYAAESEFVQRCGGVHKFELIADGDAPIAHAWTQAEVKDIARRAGLKATYVGGYLMGESSGPGLGGCWSLRPWS